MKKLKSLISLLVLFVVTFTIFAQKEPAKREKKEKEKSPPLTSQVILISIDGLRLEDLNNPNLNLPTLRALRAHGAFALNVESIYPSQSIPAHATIMTGMLPVDHGITADAPFDEKKGQTSDQKFHLAGDLKADTIWQAARRAGLKTAAINFPWTDKGELAFSSQTSAVEIIEKFHPELLLLKFDEVANSLERFGLGVSEVATAIEKTDIALKAIVDAVDRAGIKTETTFLIVSSHGYAKVEQEFRPNIILGRKGFLTADANGNITSWIAATHASNGTAAIYLRDQYNEEVAKVLEEIFADIHRKEGSPIWRILSKRDAAKLGADPRAVLFLEAAPGFRISEQVTGKKVTDKLGPSAPRAISGYLPSRSEMRGMLIMAGKGIKSNSQIEYVQLTDIAPTIARLLGFELKTARGHIISTALLQ